MVRKIKQAITLALIVALLATAIPFTAAKPNTSNSTLNNTFSIMQISDTQYLAKSYPQLFYDTTNWIVSHNGVGSNKYNVKMVIHTGDIVDNIGVVTSPQTATEDPAQWSVANTAMLSLLNNGIPYCWDAGNHDEIPWNSPSGTWSAPSYAAFDLSTLRAKSYWVSDFNNGKDTAVKFSFNGYHFLVINLEYMATDATINWMKNLLDSHSDYNVVVAAHSYINKDGGYGFLGGNIDDRTWCAALKTTLDSYPNVFLTLNGHDPTGYAYQKMTGTREEIYFARHTANSAPIPATGAATVRIYTFNLATMQVSTTTYAVNTQSWLTTTASKFTFNVNLKLAVNPTDSWITGGGWIVASGNHANLAINAKCSSDGTAKGNILYHYTANSYDWTIKTNTWTGFYIAPDNSYALLQGKADIEKTDSDGQVVWRISNYQITLEVTDGASDSMHIRVLDNAALLFHEAGSGSAGELGGGQITIHS